MLLNRLMKYVAFLELLPLRIGMNDDINESSGMFSV